MEGAAARRLVPTADSQPWYSRFIPGRRKRTVENDETSDDASDHKASIKRLRTDMIRRMDDAPKLVDPNGFVSEGPPRRFSIHSAQETSRHLSFTTTGSPERRPSSIHTSAPRLSRRLSDPGTPSRQNSLRNAPMQRFLTIAAGAVAPPEPVKELPKLPQTRSSLPRTQTVEFAPNAQPRRRPAHERVTSVISEMPIHTISEDYSKPNSSLLGIPLTRPKDPSTEHLYTPNHLCRHT